MTKTLGQQSFEKDAAALRSTLPGEWVLLDSQTLTGTVATVTFSSIPGDYRTLVLVASMRTNTAAEAETTYWQANADAGNNYDYVYMYATGAAAVSSGAVRATSIAILGIAEAASSRASCFAPVVCYWPNYANAAIEKYSTTGNNIRMGDVSADADLWIWVMGGRWRSTAAITSLTLTPEAGSWVSGCVFTLYGIL